MNPSILTSKLPGTGVSIFTRMTEAAQQAGAINLAQGFPNFMPDAQLLTLVHEAMQEGHNQYAPSIGVAALREEVSRLVARNFGRTYDPATEVTIASGGTELIFATLAALLSPGDEVVILDPAYDCYAPSVRLLGGVPVHVPLLTPSFLPDWERIAEALTPRTRLLILNNPHNPSGVIWGEAEIEALQALAQRHPFLILSDEVYAHIVFDGAEHLSVARYDDLAARSIIVGSFGKNLHVTGWKVGYGLAPAALSAEIRKAHQYLTFSTHTPTQVAMARYLAAHPAFEQELGRMYQGLRDTFGQLMAATRLTPLPCQGTYFQLYSYEQVSDLPDSEMALEIIRTCGVAAIPISAFYADGTDPRLLRFCFAKTQETLLKACTQLTTL